MEELKEKAKQKPKNTKDIRIDIMDQFLEFMLDLFGVETDKMRIERSIKHKIKFNYNAVTESPSRESQATEDLIATKKRMHEEKINAEMMRVFLKKRFS